MGFSDEELAALLANEGDNPVLEDDEPIPEPPGQPITQPGDVWLIGNHRLICRNCRDCGVIQTLLEGEGAPLNVQLLYPRGVAVFRDRAHPLEGRLWRALLGHVE